MRSPGHGMAWRCISLSLSVKIRYPNSIPRLELPYDATFINYMPWQIILFCFPALPDTFLVRSWVGAHAWDRVCRKNEEICGLNLPAHDIWDSLALDHQLIRTSHALDSVPCHYSDENSEEGFLEVHGSWRGKNQLFEWNTNKWLIARESVFV